MSLLPGTRLGPYEIVGHLGAGGMGEVYKAKDTRLDRAVAIKVLPAHLADNPQLQQRFDREARALAGLTHAHICTLHDVGDQDGVRFLVMEHLQGQTLAERLSKGPLPLDEVISAGIEIAGALDAAHRCGVVHRDIKPANIMLTKSGLKLLDFGLAREPARILSGMSGESAETATQLAPITAAGSILGTLNYMAPEQVKGHEADASTDIFALGTVLYEMATGERPFQGDSQAELIASILTSEPRSMGDLRPGIPPALGRAIDRCLTKDPDERWQSARDLMLELKWIAQSGGAEKVEPHDERKDSRWPLRIAWGIVILLAVVLALVANRASRPGKKPRQVRLSLHVPEGASGIFTRVSPDGRTLAFSAATEGVYRLSVRPLDSLDALPLAGTEGARFPFWSPDSRHLGFFADGKLKRIDISGGPPRVLCEAPGPFTMGSWGRAGTILFNLLEAPGREGIYRVSEDGGSATKMAIVDEQDRDLFVAWPSFLPDGEHFIFLCTHGVEDEMEVGGLCAASVDSGRARWIRELQGDGTRAEYSASGHLLYTSGQTLLAQRFDAENLLFDGEPVAIAEQIEQFGPIGLDSFSVSDGGVLVYKTEGSRSQLQWKDRNGRTIKTIGQPDLYTGMSLSPDGTRLAVTKTDPAANAGDIWIIDLDRDLATRFTSGPEDETVAIWTPDGRSMTISAADNAPPFLHTKSLEDGEMEVLLPSTGTLQAPLSWSPDGRELLYVDRDPESDWDIWMLSFEGDRQPVPFLKTSFKEIYATFSSDGEWVAYTSDESGRIEVYVQRYKGKREKRRISTDGGFLPRWRGDVKELFYLSLDEQLMSVPVKPGPDLTSGSPETLFAIQNDPNAIFPYDVSSDGQRFIVLAPISGEDLPPTVILGWTALLSRD